MNAQDPQGAAGIDEHHALAQLEPLTAVLGEAVVREMVQTVIDEAAGLIRTCAEAMQAQNLRVLGRQAHTLKSTSALLGAQALSRMCADIEQSAANGVLDTLNQDVEQMLKLHGQMLHQLRTWLTAHLAPASGA